MTKPVFPRVNALFQSIEEAGRVANVLDKAYADATNPTYHTPFTVESDPQKTAMNMAGLYAADTAANILVGAQGPVTEEAYLAALDRIARNDLNEFDKYLVKNCANLAWRAGQPFRDIGSKPLNRITRDVNAQFNTLPNDEQDKDLVQTCTGAKLLLEWLSKNE